MSIESGPLKHKDRIIDRIKRIFKKPPYLQHPVIDKVKPKLSKESSTNTYAKDNQAAIKKLKA